MEETKSNADDDDEGFQDSPPIKTSSHMSNNINSNASLYDIVIINEPEKYKSIAMLLIGSMVILITPILLSQKEYRQSFWSFSYHYTLLDIWLLSSVSAMILITYQNYCINYIICAIYGCYIIFKSIFFENYEDHGYINLYCYIIMIILTMMMFVISIIYHNKETNYSRSLLRLRTKPKHDDLTERLLDERDIVLSDEKQITESLLDIEETNNHLDLENKKDIKLNASSKLFEWATSEWRLLSIGTVALLIASFCSLAQPFLFGKIITASTELHGKRLIVKYSITLLVIFVCGGGATLIRSWLFTLVGERIVKIIRKELFSSIIMQDISFFDENKTGELMNRISSDTTVIQSGLGVNLSSALRSSMQIFVSILLLFITDWRLTLVMLSVVPLLVFLAITYGRYTRKLTREYQQALADSAEIGNEAISNNRLIKSFFAEAFECREYERTIDLAYEKGKNKAQAYGCFMALLVFVSNFSILVVISYGGFLVYEQKIKVGQLVSFVLYTTYIALGLSELSGLYSDVNNAFGASERVMAIMHNQPQILNKQFGFTPKTCEGRIDFEHVYFSYQSRVTSAVLDDFNLQVLPNQTIAIVGVSGGGKSTILNLLERFYDVTAGRILLDGIDIKTLNPNYLHRVISIVSQEPSLTSGTIKNNIGFSALSANLPFSNEDIINAATKANAHDFIASFPEGYDTVVGEKGVRLSGGQKQRVALARALFSSGGGRGDLKILLLDEATSALDGESERLIQEALKKLRSQLTIVIVAHRLSTVRDADSIAVVSDKQVKDFGTHEQLLKTSEIYRKLVKNQLTEIIE